MGEALLIYKYGGVC